MERANGPSGRPNYVLDLRQLEGGHQSRGTDCEQPIDLRSQGHPTTSRPTPTPQPPCAAPSPFFGRTIALKSIKSQAGGRPGRASGIRACEDKSNFGLSQGPAHGPSWAPSLGAGCEGRPPGAGAGRRNQTPRVQRRRSREVQAAAYSGGPAQRPMPTANPLAAYLVDSLQSHGGKRWRRPPGRGRGRGRDGEGARGPETARAVASRPEKTGSSRECGSDELRAEAPLSFWACRSGHRITRRRPLYALLPQPPPPP